MKTQERKKGIKLPTEFKKNCQQRELHRHNLHEPRLNDE